MDEVTLTIDGQSLTVPAGTTILEAAKALYGEAYSRQVPTICYHEATTSNALCRICVVDVQGARLLQPACVAQVANGMQVSTRNPRVETSRRTILEMLASAVDLSEAPEIEPMLAEYQADSQRFPGAGRRDPALIDDNPMYLRDYAKCVLCWRCVQVCAEDAQYAFAINFSGRGYETSIGTFFDKPMPLTTCVFCGQCVGVCPTNALKPKREFLLEQGLQPEQIMSITRMERQRKRRE
jgi:predicted molibdopterin-dependent oxidoreductase YjgC